MHSVGEPYDKCSLTMQIGQTMEEDGLRLEPAERRRLKRFPCSIECNDF